MLNSYRVEWQYSDGGSGMYCTRNPWIARTMRDRAINLGMKDVHIFMLDVSGMKIVKEVF